MDYSEDKLRKLSLCDLIALKSYLVNDRIKHWSDLMSDEDESEDDLDYQDYKERIQVCVKLKDLVESKIADRLNEIVPDYDI